MSSDNAANQPAENSGKIFLSYSREDQAAAAPIINALRQGGIDVWWDGMLEGGARYNEITERMLESAYAVVVLWSQTSIKSHWVQDEATRGRDRGCLVPASIDGTEPPLGFRQFQCIDLSQSASNAGDAQMQRLIASIISLRDDNREAGFQPHITDGAVSNDFSISRRKAIVGGGVLAASAGGLLAWKSGIFGSPSKRNSLAVLPFENLGSAQDQADFATGTTTEIRSQLARNSLLRVSAEASSSSFQETDQDAVSIANSLGVAFLLDGNLRMDGDRVRVTAELIDGETGFTSLPLEFEQPVGDIFDIQTAIAAAVVKELSAQIDDTANGGQLGGTESVAAYDAFLRGRELYDAGIDENSDRQALAKFEEAVRIDPNYAAAHAGRSRTLAIIGNLYAGPVQRDQVFGTAIEAAKRAVEIAPEFADGHAVLGFVLAMSLNMQDARAPYEEAFRLGKGEAEILSRYAIFRSRIGDYSSAASAIKSALALDPLNARAFRFSGDIAYAAGQPGEAMAAFEKAKSIQDTLSSYYYSIGLVRLQQGDYRSAKQAFETERRFVWQKTGGAIAEHQLGNRTQAQAHLDELIARNGDKSNYQYLQIYAQWGELDRAIEALAAAWETRDSGLVQLYQDPLLEPVRDRPEYIRLIEQLGFV